MAELLRIQNELQAKIEAERIQKQRIIDEYNAEQERIRRANIIKEAKQREQDKAIKIEQERLRQLEIEKENERQRLLKIQHEEEVNRQVLQTYAKQTHTLKQNLQKDQENYRVFVKETKVIQEPTYIKRTVVTKIPSPADFHNETEQFMQEFNLDSSGLFETKLSGFKGTKTGQKVSHVQVLNSGDNMSIQTITGNVVGNVREMKKTSRSIVSGNSTQVKRITAKVTAVDMRDAKLNVDHSVFGKSNMPDVYDTRINASQIEMMSFNMRRRRNRLI